MLVALRQSKSYPLVLLVLTGSTLGLAPPFAKLATASGIPAAAFAFWQNLIGGIALLLLAIMTGARPPLSLRHLRFYMISGLITLALPSVMVFLAVAQIGAGLPSIVYAFPAMLTYIIALGLRMEQFAWMRATGILFGLIGILMILAPRSGPINAEVLPWMLLAFIAPVSLAVGNIYRTRAWPKDAAPLALAAGTLLGAAFWLLIACAAFGMLYLPSTAAPADWTLIAAGLFACLSFIPYFELQRVAGPVYLSQIGYVMSATSLAIGTFVFGERYGLLVWLAAAVIVAGIVLVNRRQVRQTA
ncbi:DMT family transporter [uncultured Ferrovibrio sp.]|jgi:drug/metabolite transporter (DMT)-like permease|uniref:DMT family transporter n=1 Tax=uncultured Ferrovibrio sp. TaxID=1576913 RepID=UPI0026256671|nr:DMT family transporter [uncultured Ferrovibrio sp.]